MNDILMESLSPTQERGETSLSGGVIHDVITNAWGHECRIRIDYTLVGGSIVTDLKYEVSGENAFDVIFLKEIVEEMIENEIGKTLIFQ